MKTRLDSTTDRAVDSALHVVCDDCRAGLQDVGQVKYETYNDPPRRWSLGCCVCGDGTTVRWQVMVRNESSAVHHWSCEQAKRELLSDGKSRYQVANISATNADSGNDTTRADKSRTTLRREAVQRGEEPPEFDGTKHPPTIGVGGGSDQHVRGLNANEEKK